MRVVSDSIGKRREKKHVRTRLFLFCVTPPLRDAKSLTALIVAFFPFQSSRPYKLRYDTMYDVCLSFTEDYIDDNKFNEWTPEIPFENVSVYYKTRTSRTGTTARTIVKPDTRGRCVVFSFSS